MLQIRNSKSSLLIIYEQLENSFAIQSLCVTRAKRFWLRVLV